MATTELQAIVRFHNGDVEEFKRLSAQCMEIVRTQDTGTLQYDTYLNDDQSECIVLELNGLVRAGEVLQLQVHYGFLSAFTHATQTGYDVRLARIPVGRPRIMS